MPVALNMSAAVMSEEALEEREQATRGHVLQGIPEDGKVAVDMDGNTTSNGNTPVRLRIPYRVLGLPSCFIDRVQEESTASNGDTHMLILELHAQAVGQYSFWFKLWVQVGLWGQG